MNITTVVLFLSVMTFSATRALTQAQEELPLLAALAPEGENEKDPGYATYKAGYSLILSDKWSDAMKKFAELRSKFPKSEYVDDAAYWSAYAQKRIDRKKGISAYEKFVEEFPQSRYVDDALAEMGRSVNVVVSPDGQNVRVKTNDKGYVYSFGSTEKASEKAMRDAERALRDAEWNLRAPRPPRAITFGHRHSRERDLDPQTRVKLEALRALGNSENDREAFLALKDVALDGSQPEILRITAVEALEDFGKFDVLPVLVDLAKMDAGEELQSTAITAIAGLNADKGKSADALITLFHTLPKQRESALRSALYAVADLGTDKSVDFLVKVATGHENYELRRDAVYYLGSIGNEKSRNALMQILKSK